MIKMFCFACHYKNVDLLDKEISKKDKTIRDEIYKNYNDELKKNEHDIHEWYKIQDKIELEIKERLFKEGIVRFFKLTIDVAEYLNVNYVPHSFKDQRDKIKAYACPRCGTIRLDTGSFDPLVVQHTQAAMDKSMNFYRDFNGYP